jgi:hypothetical protein
MRVEQEKKLQQSTIMVGGELCAKMTLKKEQRE